MKCVMKIHYSSRHSIDCFEQCRAWFNQKRGLFDYNFVLKCSSYSDSKLISIQGSLSILFISSIFITFKD